MLQPVLQLGVDRNERRRTVEHRVSRNFVILQVSRQSWTYTDEHRRTPVRRTPSPPGSPSFPDQFRKSTLMARFWRRFGARSRLSRSPKLPRIAQIWAWQAVSTNLFPAAHRRTPLWLDAQAQSDHAIVDNLAAV